MVWNVKAESSSDRTTQLVHEIMTQFDMHTQLRHSDWITRVALRLSDVLSDAHFLVVQVISEDVPTIETISFVSCGVVRDNIRYRAEHSPIQKVIAYRESVIIEDSLWQYFPDDPMVSSWSAESCVCLPLQGDDQRVVGVLAVFHQHPQHYSHSVIGVLRLLGRLAAMEIKYNYYGQNASRPADFSPVGELLSFDESELAEQLRLRLDAYRDIAQGFAHEIRNPLNLMVSASKLMRENLVHMQSGKPIDAKQCQNILTNLDTVIHGGERLSQLISTVWEQLSFSEGKPRFYELNSILTRQLQIFSKDFAQRLKGVELIEDLAGDLPILYFHEEAVSKVLAHLLLQALNSIEDKQREEGAAHDKAVETPYFIKLRSALVDGTIQIEVTDNGIGLDDNYLIRVFDPFFSTKPPGKGMGLGLSLSYQMLTEGYGGQVRAFRNGPLPTSFGIYLPYRRLSGCSHFV